MLIDWLLVHCLLVDFGGCDMEIQDNIFFYGFSVYISMYLCLLYVCMMY
jgi:hypothetical protein